MRHALSLVHGELGGSPSVVYRPDQLKLQPRLWNAIRHHLARLILPVQRFVQVWTYESEVSPMVAKDLIRNEFPASTTFTPLNFATIASVFLHYLESLVHLYQECVPGCVLLGCQTAPTPRPHPAHSTAPDIGS